MILVIDADRRAHRRSDARFDLLEVDLVIPVVELGARRDEPLHPFHREEILVRIEPDAKMNIVPFGTVASRDVEDVGPTIEGINRG